MTLLTYCQIVSRAVHFHLKCERDRIKVDQKKVACMVHVISSCSMATPKANRLVSNCMPHAACVRVARNKSRQLTVGCGRTKSYRYQINDNCVAPVGRTTKHRALRRLITVKWLRQHQLRLLLLLMLLMMIMMHSLNNATLQQHRLNTELLNTRQKHQRLYWSGLRRPTPMTEY